MPSLTTFFQSPECIGSAGALSDLERLDIPSTGFEACIVGRSNVGKSSLINHLFQINRLARVSSTPGKTFTITLFVTKGEFILVDSPGYGYAARSNEEMKNWKRLMDEYLANRSFCKLIIFLVDIRHPVTEEDRIFSDWLQESGKSYILILTKADQVKPKDLHRLQLCREQELGLSGSLLYSIKSGASRQALRHAIYTRFLERA